MNHQDTKNNDRYWWVKMLVTSAALVALLLGAYLLTPVAQLHYHAWRYRTGKDVDGKHLCWVVWSTCMKRKASEQEIIQLLGPSQYPASAPGDLRYVSSADQPVSLGSRFKMGFEIEILEGLVIGVRPWSPEWRYFDKEPVNAQAH